MPNGFGFNWAGHPVTAAYRTLGGIRVRPGGTGLADAAQAAVTSLAAKTGIRLARPKQTPQRSARGSQPSSSPAPRGASGSGVGTVVAELVAALAAAAGLGLIALRLRLWARVRRAPSAVVLAGAVAVTGGTGVAALAVIGSPSNASSQTLAGNPNLDPGTTISGRAPGFRLTDQFGQPVSLHPFRGKVVLLAFNDSECTTVCPLTTTAMLDAKRMLGPAGNRVELVGVAANPKATSLEDVLSYSQLHGMLHAWHFLTGSVAELEHVWRAYKISAAIQGGEIAHTPALFVIDSHGTFRKLYTTQQSYSAVGQLGQLLAHEASNLLPDHPEVHSNLDYGEITGTDPRVPAALPRFGGGSVRLGPGQPHLYLFFATWDREITGLAAQYNAAGHQDFDAHFNVPTSTYRAYRFPWSAQPPTLPALAVAPNPDGSTNLYASWNGATDVASWRVLAGSTPGSLSTIGQEPKTGFETRIAVHSASAYFAVQPLDSSGNALSTSTPRATPAHLAIYGRSAFVSANGFGGIPAGCFANHPCHVATTISAGRTVIARTGNEAVGENDSAILYFQLSGQGRASLQHARGRRLAVQISAHDSSGTAANTSLNLVPFQTNGDGPHRSLTNSSTLKIIGVTHFVSSGWTGGILAGCAGGTPCHATATVSAGNTVIAHTGSEFLGANELGYLYFTLTAAGHAMLAHAPGNQLGAQITLTNGSATASADVALAAFD